MPDVSAAAVFGKTKAKSPIIIENKIKNADARHLFRTVFFIFFLRIEFIIMLIR